MDGVVEGGEGKGHRRGKSEFKELNGLGMIVITDGRDQYSSPLSRSSSSKKGKENNLIPVSKRVQFGRKCIALRKIERNICQVRKEFLELDLNFEEERFEGFEDENQHFVFDS